MLAIEVKRSSRYDGRDLSGLRLFGQDYPMALCVLFYGGDRRYATEGIGEPMIGPPCRVPHHSGDPVTI